MVEIGRRTTTLVHLGPPNISVCGAGRPRFILPEEPLENLRKPRQLLGNKALQNPSILFNEQLLLNLIRPFLIAIHAAIYVLEESGNFQQNPHVLCCCFSNGWHVMSLRLWRSLLSFHFCVSSRFFQVGTYLFYRMKIFYFCQMEICLYRMHIYFLSIGYKVYRKEIYQRINIYWLSNFATSWQP